MGVCMSAFATNTNIALPTCGICTETRTHPDDKILPKMPHVGSARFVLVAKVLMQTPM